MPGSCPLESTCYGMAGFSTPFSKPGTILVTASDAVVNLVEGSCHAARVLG